MLGWPCISNYMNNNQLDALFIFSLLSYHTSTCFGCISSPSSGGRMYTECPRRNVPDFGRVFLMLNYTDITQNTHMQSWTVTEIMTRENSVLPSSPRTVCGHVTLSADWYRLAAMRHLFGACQPASQVW
jgi:hypothetical protein